MVLAAPGSPVTLFFCTPHPGLPDGSSSKTYYVMRNVTQGRSHQRLVEGRRRAGDTEAQQRKTPVRWPAPSSAISTNGLVSLRFFSLSPNEKQVGTIIGGGGGGCRAEFIGTCNFLTAPSSPIPLHFSLLLTWHLSQDTLWDRVFSLMP